ncbi:MAG TPA: glycosyl hydrolase family 39 [Terracidiphilus sp.]|nr:glycosyl hydrolase family 39 [Terracidiphilus sp.]
MGISYFRRKLQIGLLAAAFLAPITLPQLHAQETVDIDAAAPTTPFPHFWEQMFGSGHAILSLREPWRDDLKAVKKVTDFQWVRFHGILDDEVGVFTRDEHGTPVYNFAYVDEIYDGLLKNNVRPLVEISFMPTQLAFNPYDLHVFWYHPNVSPPRSMTEWDDLMTHFARHLVDRYGIDEVSKWYFEVWNEPNIDFWGGIPRQQSYFELYDHTARDLKSVSPRLRVGGPATAAASWIPAFLNHVSQNHVPIDFVSTHGYADDTVENLFHNDKPVAMDDRVCAAIAKVRGQIDASPSPHLPLLWTEWNVQGMDQSRDTIFVGPALANTIRECDGKVDEMSFWTFSDVFEEGGVIPKPFEGHFGLRAKGGINKPSYYGFALLHQLGDRRIAETSNNVIATKTSNGSLVIAAWNLVDPGQQGHARTIDLVFHNVPADARITIQAVDEDHGNVLPKYRAMGSPLDPTPAQVEQLNRETALPPPQPEHLTHSRLKLTLTPDALDLVTVETR